MENMQNMKKCEAHTYQQMKGQSVKLPMPLAVTQPTGFMLCRQKAPTMELIRL